MNKRKACLWAGLLGAVIGTAGELLGGFAASGDLTSRVTILFSSLKTVPHWRLGLCAVLGGIGILLQYFGYHGIGLSFEDRENFRGRLYVTANRGFTIVGAIFHVLCCVFLYLWQLVGEGPGSTVILSGFLLWFMLPFTVLFLVSYLTVCVLLLLQIGGGHSAFGRGLVLFNPLILAVLIQAAVFYLPTSALVNGISFAGMGISSLVIFTVFLLAS